jgi:hypothetical protein
MMTKKDFVKIADSIKKIENTEEKKRQAEAMADIFSEDNPQFDRQRFFAYIEDDKDKAMKKALQR